MGLIRSLFQSRPAALQQPGPPTNSERAEYLADYLAHVTECLCCVQLAPNRNHSIRFIERVALLFFALSSAALAAFILSPTSHEVRSFFDVDTNANGALIGVLGTFIGGSIAVFFGAHATRGELNEHDKELFEAALLRYIYVIHDCRDNNSILRLALSRLISDIKFVQAQNFGEQEFDDAMEYILDTLGTLRFSKLEYPDSESAKGISKVSNPGQAALVYFNSFRESLIGLARMDFAKVIHHIKEMRLNGELVATTLDTTPAAAGNRIGPEKLFEIIRHIDFCVNAAQHAEELAVKQLTDRVLEIRQLPDAAHRCTNDCKRRLLDDELADALEKALEPKAFPPSGAVSE